MQMPIYRLIGSIFIIAGTCIGAGMLVIPIITAACGFWLSVVLLCLVALLMSSVAFLIMEVNLAYPEGINFSNMAQRTLGGFGMVITWFSFLFLMYALAAAYTAQASDLITLWTKAMGFASPIWLSALIFIILFGFVVYSGTSTVDHLNKFLILLKFGVFFILFWVLAPYIQVGLLNTQTQNIHFIWAILPILITSFGYHTILPSVRIYLNSDWRLIKIAIIAGTLLPLLLYLVWEIATLGTIPLYGDESFHYIVENGRSVTQLVEVYHQKYQAQSVGSLTNWFSNIALTTSFIGVSLALFNFNQDTYGLSKQKMTHKLPIFMVTFIPPYLFAVFYPDGFITALNYASIFVAVLLINLPALMAWQVRKKHRRNHALSQCYLIMIELIGTGLIIAAISSELGWLPVFS